MATIVLNIIGAISGALGILQFGMDNFNSPSSTGSSIRIAVGLDVEDGLNDAGGSTPDVRLWNEAGTFLGINADPGHVGSGEFKDFTVEHKGDSTQQATYAVISGNNDAVCIAYMTITWPDGSKYAWTGDWAQLCEDWIDAPWHYSHIYINNQDLTTRCMWVDKDGDQPTTGFQVHFPDFYRENADEPPDDSIREDICTDRVKFQVFTEWDPRTVTYRIINGEKRSVETGQSTAPPKNESSNQVQALAKTSKAMHFNRLIVNNGIDQSAFQLCESKSSVGPDYINVDEGLFCRMSDKSLWHICSLYVETKCFDLETFQLNIPGVAARMCRIGYQTTDLSI